MLPGRVDGVSQRLEQLQSFLSVPDLGNINSVRVQREETWVGSKGERVRLGVVSDDVGQGRKIWDHLVKWARRFAHDDDLARLGEAGQGAHKEYRLKKHHGFKKYLLGCRCPARGPR